MANFTFDDPAPAYTFEDAAPASKPKAAAPKPAAKPQTFADTVNDVLFGKGKTFTDSMREAPGNMGRGVRDVVAGVAGIPDVVANVPNAAVNTAAIVMGKKAPLPLSPFTGAAETAMDKAGAPRAKNATERVVGSAVRGATGGLATAGVAGAIPAAEGVAGNVVKTLAEMPARQVVGGATGGASGGVAHEAGAGPIGEFLASLLGGVAGFSAAGVRPRITPGRAAVVPKPDFVGSPAEPVSAPEATTLPAAPPKGPGAAPVAARVRAAAKSKAAKPAAVIEQTPEGFTFENPAAAASAQELPAAVAETTPSASNAPVLNPDAPGPILAKAAKGETVDAMGNRVDDALHRLTTNADADKLEFEQTLKSMPKEVTDPAIQARVYDDIERRMVNPNAPITPGTEAAHAAMAPLRAEEAQLFKDIKAKGYGDMVNGPEVGDGYVHRVVKGRGSFMDATDKAMVGGSNADPVMPRGRSGGSTLSKDASSLKARKYLVLEHADGVRTWVPDATGMTVDQAFLGPDMQFVKPRYATSAEIEANTGTRYHRNALVNTVDNLVRLRAVNRNIDLLEKLKPQMEQNGLLHYAQTPGLPPDHFVRLTMPQFKGAFADPKVAHVLNDFHGELQRGGDLSQIITSINRFLTGSIFITPIPHAWNVANHWATGRGWDWIKPAGYHSLMVDGTRAIKAVLTQNRDYQALLREGSGLVYGGVHNQNFHNMLIDKLGGEIMADPKAWTPIAKMFGYANPVQLVKSIYRLSSKTLWAVNDMFMVQRQLELMRKGMPVRKAILEAEKDIPNYRLPSYVGVGPDNVRRATSELMRNPNYMMFGRYRYGQFKAYAEMAKEMFRKGAPPQERRDGAGKLFIMAAMAMGAYPMLDKLLQLASGNDHAEVHRGGGLTPVKAVVDVARGEKSWGAGTASVLSPAPLTEAGVEFLSNKDGLGRNIVEPESSFLGKQVQRAEWVGSKVSPVATVLNMIRNRDTEGSAAASLAPMAAMKLPTDKSVAGKAKGKMYDRRRAAKREAKDPLQRIVESIIGDH